jgi:hypothetical protein
LRELKKKKNWNVWTKHDKISFTNEDLSNGIEHFLYFYSRMVVKIRTKAVCLNPETTHSWQSSSGSWILRLRSDILHKNTLPLHLADPFIKFSYFIPLEKGTRRKSFYVVRTESTVAMLFYFYFVENKVGPWVEKIKQLGEVFDFSKDSAPSERIKL